MQRCKEKSSAAFYQYHVPCVMSHSILDYYRASTLKSLSSQSSEIIAVARPMLRRTATVSRFTVTTTLTVNNSVIVLWKSFAVHQAALNQAA